jgi:predicted ferric reductase
MCSGYFIASPIFVSAIERPQIDERGIESYEPAILVVGTEDKEARASSRRRTTMLWTIFVILLVLWLLGLVTSYTLGGFIHILLVIAVVVLVIQLVQGRRVV